MQIFKKVLFIATALVSSTHPIWGEDDLFFTDENESILVEPTDNFYSVIKHLDHYLTVLDIEAGREVTSPEPASREYQIDLKICENGITLKPCKKGESSRNYLVPVSSQEKKDIRHIVTTLARDNLASLATSRSSLKKIGARIDHLHPLKFLSTVFTDEELKAGIHAIRDRGWVWDEFASGLIGSLREEAANQNMKMQFIEDFANAVGISIYSILPAIQESRWKDFINTLIDNIPRANDPNRYNM